MKILRIVSSGFEEGGVENGIALMQPHFENRGHDIRILSSDLRPDMPHFNHYTFKAPGRFKPYHTFNPHAYRTLKQLLREFEPDVVHLHTIGAASPSILFALNEYPTVATIHGPEGYTRGLLLWCMPPSDFISAERCVETLTPVGRMRYFYYRRINYPLFKRGLRAVDRFVTLSAYMQDLMRKEHIESVHIPNATNIFDYSPICNTTNNQTLLFVGRLEAFKGVDYLLQALPLVAQRFPSVKLFIAGDGVERKNLKSQARNLGIDGRVVFLGNCARDDLAAQYPRAGVLVMPSVWPEAFGKVGIEAMSVGRPVIASAVGGVTEWLRHGENGLTVPPRDAKAIADACITLFTDPAKMTSMGKVARQTAEEFSLERHAMLMEALYTEVIAERKEGIVSRDFRK